MHIQLRSSREGENVYTGGCERNWRRKQPQAIIFLSDIGNIVYVLDGVPLILKAKKCER